VPDHHRHPPVRLQWHHSNKFPDHLLLHRSRLMLHRLLLLCQKASPSSQSQSSISRTSNPIRICIERKANALTDRPLASRSSKIEEKQKHSHRRRKLSRDPKFRCRLCLLWQMKSSGGQVATLRHPWDLQWHMCPFEGRITCAVTTWSSLWSRSHAFGIHSMFTEQHHLELTDPVLNI
jgi:hypothetical protein